jgi:hypothetical protein
MTSPFFVFLLHQFERLGSVVNYGNLNKLASEQVAGYPALLFKMQLGFAPQCGTCWINWIPA